jgi:hypothetical protein
VSGKIASGPQHRGLGTEPDMGGGASSQPANGNNWNVSGRSRRYTMVARVG